jgi:tetrahydromethanopterin S-methyltransferase subunit B
MWLYFIFNGGKAMLYVNFTRGTHPKISKHERIPFPEAVKLSQEIEMEMREKKKTIDSYFFVIDPEYDEEMYEGTFQFGSYTAPNLFIHIKKKLAVMKTDKEKEKIRLAFITEMDELIEDQYKKEEDTEHDILNNLDVSKISRFNRWQRRTIYSIAGFFALTAVGVFSYFFIQIAVINQEYQAIASESDQKGQVINYYENALLGDTEELEQHLASIERSELSSQEKIIYAGYVADEGDFDKLNTIFENDTSMVATFLSNNKDTAILRQYHDSYPTNEARFDLAFADENYEEVVEIENVELSTTRSIKKTYAYLKIDNLDAAKEELEGNNSSEMKEKIERYEELKVLIAKLDEEIDDAEEKDQKQLKKDKKVLVEELNSI